VGAITFQDGRYSLNNRGDIVEYAVKMRQLPEEDSLEMRLRSRRIDSSDIEALARKLSDFYTHADTGEGIDFFGSWETINLNCEENFSQIQSHLPSLSETDLFQIIRSATRSFLQRRRNLFNQRIRNGKIRDCHGDLRCDHIYFNNEIQIIDCIEFNERFRFSDVTGDLAFLSMDLDFLGFPEISNSLIRNYAQMSRDHDTYILMDFYKCYRAMVRVKVNCLRCKEIDTDNRLYQTALQEAHRHMDLAYHCAVRFSRPTLWIVFGMPASGKSTVAKVLSNILAIDVIRSDIIRKSIFGMKPYDSAIDEFESGIYSKEATAMTYGRMLLGAQEKIQAGNSLILDATFSKKHQRQEALRLARDEDCNVIFIECRAPRKVLIERLKRRDIEPSISDARYKHLDRLRKRFTPIDDLSDELRIVIDTHKSLEENIRKILEQDYLIISKSIEERIKRGH
jgi:hypothetical protein